MQKDRDTGAVLLCALRYCIGRQTYMPSLVVDWAKRYWEFIHEQDRACILKDLNDAINDTRRSLGDKYEKTWMDFKAWMEKQDVTTDK